MQAEAPLPAVGDTVYPLGILKIYFPWKYDSHETDTCPCAEQVLRSQADTLTLLETTYKPSHKGTGIPGLHRAVSITWEFCLVHRGTTSSSSVFSLL